MKIAIIGAGNLGTAIAADLGRRHEVRIHSSRPQCFTGSLHFEDQTMGEVYDSPIARVSDDYGAVLSGAELVFVTLPTQLVGSKVEKILPYIEAKATVGFVPGAGGVEYLSSKLISKGCCVFGFERVPFVSRLVEYGKSVNASKKAKYRIAVFPKNRKERLAQLISDLFDRPCGEMRSFISMTLTPTLHTSRLYDLYADYELGTFLTDNPFFYAEWRDSASITCLQLDDELHYVAHKLEENGLDVSELVPYSIHYESPTVEALTKKLRSIVSLSKIKGPVIENLDGTYTLDLDSRYFTESFPFRLAIVKGLAELVDAEVPVTTKVLKWYERLKQKQYFIGEKLKGKDVAELNIPQNHGINSITDLIAFYDGAC